MYFQLDPDTDPNVIKVLAISDTHGHHSEIKNIPSADILVHAGDFTESGSWRHIQAYNEWIGDLLLKQNKFKFAVLIAGNHDITLDQDYYTERGYKTHHKGLAKQYKICADCVHKGISVYLEDEAVELLGITIYGSPYQPEYNNWAFNLPRGDPLKKKWAEIPDRGVDVLITHGPPKYHGDKVMTDGKAQNTGCQDLLERLVQMQERPRFHVFGHVHQGYGVTRNQRIDGVTLINASTQDSRGQCANKPIMFYIKGRGRQYSDTYGYRGGEGGWT